MPRGNRPQSRWAKRPGANVRDTNEWSYEETDVERQPQTRVHELSREESIELLQLHSYVGRIGFLVDGEPLILPVNYLADGDARLHVELGMRERGRRFERAAPRIGAEVFAESGRITAPMPGMIVEVLAKPGLVLKRGSKLAVLEAMKTQLPLIMPFDGVVESVSVEVGRQVDQDEPIASVKRVERA